jgi:hypothetical protein
VAIGDRRITCETCKIMAKLPDGEREDFIREKHSSGLTWKQIAQALRSAGYTNATYHSLQRHMRGDCSPNSSPVAVADLFTPAA